MIIAITIMCAATLLLSVFRIVKLNEIQSRLDALLKSLTQHRDDVSLIDQRTREFRDTLDNAMARMPVSRGKRATAEPAQ